MAWCACVGRRWLPPLPWSLSLAATSMPPTSSTRYDALQMSLDIKREEIAKLDRKAAEKEAALQKSEALLEEDAGEWWSC